MLGAMKAVTVSPTALTDAELPDPTPGDNDLLVAVEAVSVNPIDYKMRARYERDADGTKVLGFDAVGTVKEVGKKATGFQPGDRVFYAGAQHRQGTNAELHVVDHRIAAHAPESLSAADAASLPLVSLTAYEGLFDRLQVPETGTPSILVVGGAGGVGSQVSQLANALTDAFVFSTFSRGESRDWLEKVGAHRLVDHSGNLVDALKENLVDYIFSTHSNGRAEEYAALLRPQGKVLLIDSPKDFTYEAFKQKSISVHWESMFTRPNFETEDIARQQEILATVARLADEGKIRPLTTTILEGLSAETFERAHELLKTDRSIGKLVVTY